MAYAPSRSCNNSLHYGINDGVYKDAYPNWGNIQGNDATVDVRQQMSGVWHGFNEAPVKYLPDGRSYQTHNSDIAPEDDYNV